MFHNRIIGHALTDGKSTASLLAIAWAVTGNRNAWPVCDTSHQSSAFFVLIHEADIDLSNGSVTHNG